MDFTSSNKIEITKLALDGLYERQRAIAANTANVNTPNYQRKDVVFEDKLNDIINREELKSEIKQANSLVVKNQNYKPIDKLLEKTNGEDVKAFLEEDNYSQFKVETLMDMSKYDSENGNNVILEKEMMDMTEAAMRYNILSTLQGRNFSGLQSVIKGE